MNQRVPNEAGGYLFLPSVRPFSAGVVADEGHEIVRVPTRAPAAGLAELLQAVAERYKRPLTALCAVELRSAHPVDWDAFASFNEWYASVLDSLDITLDGVNPVARTNVVPAVGGPSETVVHAISLTVPRTSGRPTFVVAGAAEVEGNRAAGTIRPGESGGDAMREKVDFVVARMVERLAGLGVERDAMAAAHVYTARPLDARCSTAIGRATGDGEGSFCLHVAKPPIEGLEFEMDMRSVLHEPPA